jgi:type II secretory pathway pseudopilin PulG
MKARGFTLVELMVAITGGLFIAIIVFALARDGARFYQRESRVADATLSAVVGFERLRAEIGRAGFLAAPNVRQLPRLCGDPIGDATWPAGLKSLASVRIEQAQSPGSDTLRANGLNPDRIVVSGSFASNEQFPIWNITGTTVFLQRQTGPLARLGYNLDGANQAALLASLFPSGRALRIQDQAGEIQFAVIAGTQAGAIPQITLAPAPALIFRQTAGTTCGLRGNATGAVVNVVNFAVYEVRALQGGDFDRAFGAGNPWDADRTELVREELDAAGNVIPGTEELIAEHAVDLRFGVTVAQGAAGAPLALATLPPDSGQIPGWAGDITAGANPHRIRSVRVRLSVRSGEPDRPSNVPVVDGIAQGLYRIGLGSGGGSPFARVRTLQTEVALHNQMGATQ